MSTAVESLHESITFEEKRFRIKGITTILGSVPLNKDVYSKFIATKAREIEKAAAEKDVDAVPDMPEEKATGFYRNANGEIILKGYQIKGFLKEAAKVLKDQMNLKAYLSKMDNFVFIKEAEIPIIKDGHTITETDGFLERPLRAETAQGPRTSLAKSEQITEGWELEFTIRVVKNEKTAKSANVDMEMVEKLLAYGQLKGLLQWRNAGYGSFTCEEVVE